MGVAGGVLGGVATLSSCAVFIICWSKDIHSCQPLVKYSDRPSKSTLLHNPPHETVVVAPPRGDPRIPWS